MIPTITFYKIVKVACEYGGVDSERFELNADELAGITNHLVHRYVISGDTIDCGDRLWYVKRMLLSNTELDVELIEVR
jgi:hypothetical protein